MLLDPWLHWDVEWYLEIVSNGFQKTNGTLQFHPLYPLLARFWLTFELPPLFGLLMVSSLSGLIFLIIFYQLARLDQSEAESQLSLLLLSFFPISFILYAPYPESLFLACSCTCLLAMRKHHWWLAGIAGALASLTRQQGLLLILPLAWEAWQMHRSNWRALLRPQPAWAAALLTVTGYMGWIIYRSSVFRETTTNLTGINEFIYSFLISPTADQVVPTQSFQLPWRPIYLAIRQFITRPNVDLAFNLSMTAWFLLALGFGWKGMIGSYRLYVVSLTLVSFSYFTGPIHPIMGLPRHLFLAFPVFIGLSPGMRAPFFRLAWVGTGMLGMFGLILGYCLEAWVP